MCFLIFCVFCEYDVYDVYDIDGTSHDHLQIGVITIGIPWDIDYRSSNVRYYYVHDFFEKNSRVI